MINHIRTLLLNAAPASGGWPGDEYVPPEFAPVVLSAGLKSVRRILFGNTPDRGMLNFRVAQLLGAVHGSPMAEYVPLLDPRIVYRPLTDGPLVDPATYVPQVLATNGGTTAQLVLGGEPAAPDVSGQIVHRFAVANTAADVVTVRRTTPAPPLTTPIDVSRSGGLSSPVPLGATGYTVRLATADTAPTWYVDIVLRPRQTPGEQLAELAVAGEEALLDLFGISTAEPLATFRSVWRTARDTPLRVAAVALALAWRTEQRRTGHA